MFYERLIVEDRPCCLLVVQKPARTRAPICETMFRLCVNSIFCLTRHRRATAIVVVLATVAIFAVGLSLFISSENYVLLPTAKSSTETSVSFVAGIEPMANPAETMGGELSTNHSLSSDSEKEMLLKAKKELQGAAFGHNVEPNLQNRNLKEVRNDPTSKNIGESVEGVNCSWVNATYKPPYFLTAVILYRIYEADKAKLTTTELKQWLQYMRYIGVEHVYAYDAYVTPDESQKSALARFINDGYVTMIDWSKYNPYSISGTQVAAYRDCKDRYQSETVWQTAIDVDEYPFSPVDTKPGFLYRFMEKYTRKNPKVSEISMQNYLFLGKPLEKELLMERLWRHTHGPANQLVKPIYKPTNIQPSVSEIVALLRFIYGV